MKTGCPLVGVCLPSYFGKRRRQPGREKINGLGSDCVDTIGMDVLSVLLRTLEPRSELGFFKVGEGGGDLAYHLST